jgi:hypothetical protein
VHWQTYEVCVASHTTSEPIFNWASATNWRRSEWQLWKVLILAYTHICIEAHAMMPHQGAGAGSAVEVIQMTTVHVVNFITSLGCLYSGLSLDQPPMHEHPHSLWWKVPSSLETRGVVFLCTQKALSVFSSDVVVGAPLVARNERWESGWAKKVDKEGENPSCRVLCHLFIRSWKEE